MSIRQQLKNNGDTIVEVLIAMTVVSMVLAGAFASTRQSASAIRTAQEQGEALKLAESQVERIRQAAGNSSNAIWASTNQCLDVLGSLEVTCTVTNGIDYRTTVSHTSLTRNFGVKVEWDGLTGGTNKVELFYRAY